uniref:BPTI/Kunitz inhibitor domain-containing protein n=1 Tax=Meloidogyne hapla TaxID=6305 RepID=A0A1I8C2E7_MELHA
MINKNYLNFNKQLIIFTLFLLLINQNVLTESQKERNENENPHCSLPHDKGVKCSEGTKTTENSKQFYYNSQTGLCQPFIYNGCEGNANRFASAGDCRKACSSSEKKDPWVLGGVLQRLQQPSQQRQHGCRRRVLPDRRGCWCCWRLQVRLPRSLRGAAPTSNGAEGRQLVNGTQRDDGAAATEEEKERTISMLRRAAINNPISTNSCKQQKRWLLL